MEEHENSRTTDGYEQLAREILEELRHLGKTVRPHVQNMARGEVGALHVLRMAGEPLTPTMISERTGVSTARVANILRSLEAKGWVSREHSTVDRRRVTVSPTKEGLAALDEKYGFVIGCACEFLGELGDEDAHEMLRLLRRTNEMFDARRAAGAGEGTAR